MINDCGVEEDDQIREKPMHHHDINHQNGKKHQSKRPDFMSNDHNNQNSFKSIEIIDVMATDRKTL